MTLVTAVLTRRIAQEVALQYAEVDIMALVGTFLVDSTQQRTKE